MTAQARDLLTYKDVIWQLSSEPLKPLIEAQKVPVKFEAVTSSNWRGYTAEWAVIDDQLWLTKLSGTVQLEGGQFLQTRPTDLHEVVGATGPVIADWFTGELKCAAGKLVEYVHGGYQSRFEHETSLFFLHGMLESVPSLDRG